MHTLKTRSNHVHRRTTSYHAHTEEQAVTMQTLKNKHYHANTEEQPVTMHTALKNKQLPSTQWRTTSYHVDTEEQPVIIYTVENNQLPYTH